jgi:putative copper export protein
MSTLVHTLHVILAGTWLGGVVFTTAVVSPALKAMKWETQHSPGPIGLVDR